MEKPTKVEPGQRYKTRAGSFMTVDGTTGADYLPNAWYMHWDGDGPNTGVMVERDFVSFGCELLPATPSPPPASPVPVVCVGQRRKWRNGTETDEFVITEVTAAAATYRYPLSGVVACRPIDEVADSELLSPSTPVQPTATAAPAKECLACTSRFFEAGKHTCEKLGRVPEASGRPSGPATPAVANRDPNTSAGVAGVTRAFQKREVSTDGKTFVNYDAMQDPDAFEVYHWRKLDGVLQLSAWAQYVEGDRVAAMMTEMEQSSRVTGTRSPPDTRPKPQSLVHDRGCLGIWNTRGR